MSENIVNKIQSVEREAEQEIEKAKKKGHAMVVNAGLFAEQAVKDFNSKLQEQLKKFREERTAFYKAESEKLRASGAKNRSAVEREMEGKLPEIKKRVTELVKKELCL